MYTNLKVTLNMFSPISVEETINLDTLILLVLAKEKLGDNFYMRTDNAYFTEQEAKNMLSEVLEFSEEFGVFHSSNIIQSNVKKFNINYTKKFHTKNADLISFKGNVIERVETGAGKFKNYQKPIFCSLYTDNKLTFYCRANKENLKRVLDNLYFIGKKSSQGFGAVKNYVVEEIENDYSLFKEDMLHRSIDFSNAKNKGFKNVRVGNYPLIPPYRRKEKYTCLIPRFIK